jgi:phospholipase/carboxylesterase
LVVEACGATLQPHNAPELAPGMTARSGRIARFARILPMTSELLPAVTIETGARPSASVIWLHGLGDDGHGWSQVVPALRMPPSVPARFLFPHAPVMPVTINNGYAMRAWYDIRENDFNNRADLAGVRRSQQHVEALIAREEAQGIAASRIVLAGFSQGGAIALYAGLRHPERLAGIVALSSYLIAPDALAVEASAANRDVPIFMAHGTQDPVVQFRWADASRMLLVAAGYRVEWHTYPMLHSAAPEEIVAIGQFLARILGP